MAEFTNTIIEYKPVLNQSIQFGVGLKVLPSKGNLVYEYNPFRNYRLSSTGYRYKNKLYSPKELWVELGQTTEDSTMTDEDCLEAIEGLGDSWGSLIPDSEEDPTLVEEGELTDFETDELSFDVNHPVNLLPQYSYDNSVNLIINDGKNKPKLINSRFSATARNKYQIVDRKGNNDTNIYDQGSQFDIDTSLYKRTVEIPHLRFVGVLGGGQLQIGNYHFYFRYADADGNETDFVAESGLVSIFIGTVPSAIRSGFRNENSHKGVQFLLTNIDSSYQYVNVYYTKATADILQNATVQAYKINQKFLVNNALKCNILITGYEDVTEIDTSEINPFYLMVDSAETQASCQNRLFLGNVHRPDISYQELTDLSLRFLPYIESASYPLQMDADYNVSSTSYGYYDTKFIYNKVGYWNHEYYRFGIVYILSDSSLSPVFNIRGAEKIGQNDSWSDIPMWSDDEKTSRNYIVTEEDTYRIVTEADSYSSGIKITGSSKELENSLGVISIDAARTGQQEIYSIGIKVDKEVTDYLKNKLNIKGFFFVRQKRIPTILCQAYTIGIDKESRTPVLPLADNKYIAERFIDDDQTITSDFELHKYIFEKDSKIRKEAAICPEYDVDSPYLNSLFTGDSFAVCESDVQPSDQYLTSFSERKYYAGGQSESKSNSKYICRIVGIEDNTKLAAIGDDMFSARAGEAEEAFRFEYLEKENKITDCTNLIRGSFGPYLGIKNFPYSGKLIDIKIPGYFEMSEESLFKIRYNDKNPFYAISERIALKELDDWFDLTDSTYKISSTLYRGDCYICQFTHRLNRNFQDPSAPINDKIVDKDCWKDNFEITDDVIKMDNFENINLGDVNAVKLGMWVTFTVRSTKNLNIRSIDNSIPDEEALTGHPRTFFPYGPASPEGAYKVPEALCYNKGFEKSVSERVNFEVPDVPTIKNDFTNRICYSDINVNDAFKNGFRVFQGTHFRDYPKTYGSITALVELRGSLICVFEHGVALIAVNERALTGEGSGGNLYINTSNVLPENPKIISDKFGSQWRESIIKTPRGVYGVDTIGKKIWRTDGNTFELISDFRIQEFLNNNISLTERELTPIIGVRNVKAHFNAFKNDVMFTFYDNLYGFEEKVWNICFNESLDKWITFYSWVPSYSENIYNQYFSFDRNTSKWITKLGISHADNDFADGVVLSENVIPNSAKTGTIVGELGLANRTLPSGTGISVSITYELERDIYQNYKKFGIQKQGDKSYLVLKVNATDLCSEMYVRGKKSANDAGKYDQYITDISTQKQDWLNNCVLNSNYCACKNERGIRINLDKPFNTSTLVTLLNIRANIDVSYDSKTPTDLEEAYVTGQTNTTHVDAGYYESVVAVIPQYNMQFLTTDFWKHGQAGIIDIADPIAPTYWYGKQHPFEFEFIVADNPGVHKIFDNLEIISNHAEPESFHYEIIGDCFDFAKDKKNMYIRQEATKELFQYNGYDITYDHDYIDLTEQHRTYTYKANSGNIYTIYDKSTIMPLWYSRTQSINEIEDYYHLKDGAKTKDFSAMAGGEIVKYWNLDEFRIWNHTKAVDITDDGGRMRGNMQYKEDKWDVQINPINIVQRNEPAWDSVDLLSTLSGRETISPDKIPIELGQNPMPDEEKTISFTDASDIPDNSQNRAVVTWKWDETNNSKTRHSEAKIKDKWLKVRIRYTGDKLAIISAVRTLYSISYA